MARLSRSKWPSAGPVRELLSYLESLHEAAGRPSLSEIGRGLALAPSTISAFFTGARLIGRGNLELLVEYLEGDVQRAEALRRKAAVAWEGAGGAKSPQAAVSEPMEETGSRLDIVFYDTPVNKLNRPERLVGREELAARIHGLLDNGERVLLFGMGGSGKTALAATVADQRVEAGKGSYLWLRPGSSDGEATIDGIVRSLAAPAEQTRIAQQVGDAQLQAIRNLLAQDGIGLWVIDDVWHPQVLYGLLRVLPESVAVLVTSRLKIDVGQLVDVGGLPPDDAVKLLNLHARNAAPAGAEELCRALGYHAYAIEIAGRHLRQYDTTPAELHRLLEHAPHALTMPGGYSAQGRESVQRLLDRTYEALDHDDARGALAAVAAFSSGTASVELLAIHLGFDQARTTNALNRLVDVSLAKRIPGTSTYSVHDLTFAYARSIGAQNGLKSVIRFAEVYRKDYQLLSQEMDNLLGAAARARTDDPEGFLSIVETLAVGGYLDDYGHTLGLLRLLDEAIEHVRHESDRCHTLLTKRGNAAYNQGEHELAINLYVQALDLSPTPQRRIILMSLIGKVLAELGRHDEAEEQFDQAYAISETTGDEQARLRILEQHSVAAFRRKDYLRVRELASDGLELSRRLETPFQEAIFLNNLGTAEFELGVCKAIELHRQAQGLAVQMDNDHVLALTHRTLGADFHAQESFDQAQQHFQEALLLYGKLGQSRREADLRKFMQRFGYLS
ncbi:MAG TPA: tetratricopeptide repeat protein [Candidatus Limnocylindrales bacterium]|nr:tetratricopeptide repeat protein [Candidatus Limnocylindrales bacterium]